MASLNQVIRERKKMFRELKKLLRDADTAGELAERLISRVLSRRLKVPEQADLAKLADYASLLNQALRAFVAALARGFPV